MIREMYAKLGRMTEQLKNDGKPTLTDLMFHPDRDALEQEFDMVLERAKQRGVERDIIADTLFHYLRQHMTPERPMTDLVALRWINQLRRYHTEIGNTLGVLDELLSIPPVQK